MFTHTKCGPPTLAAPFSPVQARRAQTAWAEYLRTPVEVTSRIGMRFRLIPPGEFTMGGDATPEHMVHEFRRFDAQASWFADELPAHHVRITRPFWLGKFPVRTIDYQKFVSATGYLTDAETGRTGGWGFDNAEQRFRRDERFNWRYVGRESPADDPVVNLTWYDTQAFVEWLAGLDGGLFRLPSEAEWEYAARAGSTGWYYHGGNIAQLPSFAHFTDECPVGIIRRDRPSTTEPGFTGPVGRRHPNAFGLFDALGNVFEWLSDWYDGDFYRKSSVANPLCTTPAKLRACRGGSWLADPAHCRCAHRYGFAPSECSFTIGLRVLWIRQPYSDLWRCPRRANSSE